MSEFSVLEMEQGNNGHGKIEIAPEVIEVIAGIAASEVEGVITNAARGHLGRLPEHQPGADGNPDFASSLTPEHRNLGHIE